MQAAFVQGKPGIMIPPGAFHRPTGCKASSGIGFPSWHIKPDSGPLRPKFRFTGAEPARKKKLALSPAAS